MSLSASTLALFLLLVPGLIFRYAVYQGSLVKRPFFASSTIYSSISVILYSSFIFILFFVICKSAAWLVSCFNGYRIPLNVVEFNSTLYIFHQSRRYEIVNFIVNFPYISIALFTGICLVAFGSAIGVQKMARRIRLIGRLMYGPLAPMISRKDTALLTCFVLTKISHENRRLMYAGYPSEISLREGNNIDHIIIENPEKFYLKLNREYPASSFSKARRLSVHGFGESYIYVSGTEIENVHFEGFYFE